MRFVYLVLVVMMPACVRPPASAFVYVAVIDGNFEIFLAEGDARRNLTNNDALDYHPAWSAAGECVLFYSNRGGDYDVYIMDPGGNHIVNLTNHPARDINPVAGPDGQIAFVSDRDGDRELYLMDTQGHVRQLTHNEHLDDTPTWSPDGTALAYTSGEDIHVLTVATGASRILTPREGRDGSPAWSPDGLQIAFSGSTGADTVSLFTINHDGSGLRRLPNQAPDERHPRWSPDGRWLLYTASVWDSTAVNSDVWLTRADGTHRRPLLTGPHRQELAVWRPPSTAPASRPPC